MRWCRPLAALAGGAVLLGWAVVGPAGSQVAPAATAPFAATAAGRTASVEATTVPGLLFDQLVDAGYGVAQAGADALGASDAFASSPYPSGSVVLLPGLVAGLTEGATSAVVPPYPLIASSTHPLTPEQRVALGPVDLLARSSAGRSSASARDGLGTSRADVSSDDGIVVARASSAVADLEVSPVLVLHGVRATAEVRREADGSLARRSSFEVAAVSVLGQRLALGGRALDLLGQDVDLPIADVLGPLLAALAGQGTTIEVVPERLDGDGGITSAGLRISSRFAPPPAVAAGVEEVVAEITVGGASASVTGPSDTAPPSGDPDGGPAGVGDLGGDLLPTGPDLGAGLAPVAGPGPVPSAPTTIGPGATGPGPTRLVGAVDRSGLGDLFPLLLGAGAVLVGVADLVRHLAVRNP